MQELWPIPSADVDIAHRLAGDDRPKPSGRPWVAMVMIASIDGAIAVDGVSGGLGSAADQQRFVAARRQADAIIVGATTVTAEDYQPTPTPIVVISGTLSSLDPSTRLFGDPDRRPIVFTTDQAASTRGADFDGIAELRSLGDSVDPARVLADLDDRGIASVVLEGGPTLNSLFLRADLVDELLLSYAPVIVGGEGAGIVAGPMMPANRGFALDRVLVDDSMIFVRYLRADQ